MKNSFNVSVNEQIIYSYTEKPSPARLRRFLDEMDQDMQQGIQLGDTQILSPNEFQKLQYVAMQLFHSLDKKDFNLAEVMSAYLLSRNGQLSEINITQHNDIINIKLSLT